MINWLPIDTLEKHEGVEVLLWFDYGFMSNGADLGGGAFVGEWCDTLGVWVDKTHFEPLAFVDEDGPTHWANIVGPERK